jgi:hypothetical protein
MQALSRTAFRVLHFVILVAIAISVMGTREVGPERKLNSA